MGRLRNDKRQHRSNVTGNRQANARWWSKSPSSGRRFGLLDHLRCKQELPVFHQLEWKDVANVDFTVGLLAGVK